MEENTEQIPEQAEEGAQWEQLSWNKNDRYVPTEFEIRGYLDSWKKCHCGRQARFNDNFCPSCGQRLGRPSMDE